MAGIGDGGEEWVSLWWVAFLALITIHSLDQGIISIWRYVDMVVFNMGILTFPRKTPAIHAIMLYNTSIKSRK